MGLEVILQKSSSSHSLLFDHVHQVQQRSALPWKGPVASAPNRLCIRPPPAMTWALRSSWTEQDLVSVETPNSPSFWRTQAQVSARPVYCMRWWSCTTPACWKTTVKKGRIPLTLKPEESEWTFTVPPETFFWLLCPKMSELVAAFLKNYLMMRPACSWCSISFTNCTFIPLKEHPSDLFTSKRCMLVPQSHNMYP